MKFLKNEQLMRPGLAGYRDMEKMPVTIVLDNVRSGHNVGSVFRSADSFTAERIFLCGITASPPDREILKSALGATDSVEWRHFSATGEALRQLKSEGYRIWAVEQCDVRMGLETVEIKPESRYALVFGNEVKGVDESLIPLLDACVEIPQSGTKHSLNISVCAGIVLWKFYEKLVLKA